MAIGRVPRFFFHIEDVNFASDDKEGFDLPSVDAACVEALATIGAIITDELIQGQEDIPVTVKIRNEAWETVADLAVRTRVIASDISTKNRPR